MDLSRIDHLTEKDFARLKEYAQVRQPSTARRFRQASMASRTKVGAGGMKCPVWGTAQRRRAN